MIDLNGIKAKNRYFIAAGPAKYGRGYAIYENPLNFFLFRCKCVKPEIFGAVTTKTLTLEPRRGNYRWWKPWEVLRRIPGGWVNRFGWNNCGIKYFAERVYPRLGLDNLIVSIGALRSAWEITAMIEILNKIDIIAVEINISCPHVDIRFRYRWKEMEMMFIEAAHASRHPLIVKLEPGIWAPFYAKMAEECGINAVCAVNTLKVAYPFVGGASGPQLKPLALDTVREVCAAVKIPVIGGGGIYTASDCDEFFAAGAKAVFFSSVFLDKPLIPGRIVRDCLQ